MSVPLHDETIDSNTKRDTGGRLFNGITPENFQLIFERIGFSLISRWDNDDSLGREQRKWATLLFVLRNSKESRPIDTIESILNRDKKTATYKLALFRALSEIAITNYNLAQWQPGGKVKIPIRVVAEKWMEYFWPLMESKIKQTTGAPSAFGKTMELLLEYYRGNKGGLTRFSIEYKNGKLTPEAFKLADRTLKDISSTIWNQPVRYAGGGNFSVFQYDMRDKTIIVGADIWRELSLTGPWIADATILRWAELTSRISKNTIKPSEVIDCLLTVPIPEREVSLAKSLYDSISEKCCVWTDKTIKNKYPACFDYEVSKFIGQEVSKLKSGWENILFANFAEAIEITAIQRGVERWQPASFAATGINEAYLQIKLHVEKEHASEKIAVPFFPDLEVACGAFKPDSSRTDYVAETIEIEDIHGNLDPKRHFVVRASGDSMDGGNAPVRNGDLLLLERNEGGTVSNQIFAVKYLDEFGGTSYVLKRIEKDAPGQYRLVSANKDYDDIPVATGSMFPFARLKKNIGKMKSRNGYLPKR